MPLNIYASLMLTCVSHLLELPIDYLLPIAQSLDFLPASHDLQFSFQWPMSYNPVAEATSNVSAAFQAEGVKYGELYASQGRVHIEASWSLWVAIALFLLVIANGTIEGRPWSRWLHKTSCFGIDIHTSRAQFLVLVVYLIYITVSSFANIPYGHSYRYVSHHAPGFVQKATTLQFIANRTGFLAFASVPLTFMLVARVGVVQIVILSYHQLNFLHRWVGWTVLILSWVHAVLWTVEMGLHSHIEGGYLATRWHKRYWIGGCFAILFLSYVTLHSFPTIRRLTGYEFFRITHKLGAILFLIGCWVHWPEAFQWIAGALAIYLFDKLWKYSWYVVKYRKAGGKTTLCGKVSTDADGASVAIITISNTGIGRWQPGQHVYLSCITLGEWQSHPFSVANTGQNTNEMLLIVREKSGMTRKLLDHLSSTTEPVTVMLDGPFGFFRYDYLFNSNILLIVGGTGISFALSVLDYFSKQDRDRYATVKLVWYIRRAGKTS